MSDFLTNLTSRSLGSAPNLLKPQLPFLFESPKGSASILDGAGRLNAQEESSEISLMPVPAADRPRVRDVRVNENIHSSTPVHDEPAGNSAVLQTIVPYEPPQRLDMSAGNQQQAQVKASPTVSVAKDDEEPKQSTGLRPEAATRLAERTNGTQTSRNIETRLVPVLPKMGTTRPRDQTKPETETASPERGSAAVHISIGRIEVRAVTQPSAAVRPARSNRPSLTLDEYLQHRDGSKR